MSSRVRPTIERQSQLWPLPGTRDYTLPNTPGTLAIEVGTLEWSASEPQSGDAQEKKPRVLNASGRFELVKP